MAESATVNKMFSHHKVLANSIKLHYVTGGRGPAVLLLHGWPQTWWEWRWIMPSLAEQFTVVALDLRGFGDSEKPMGGYDAANLCADVGALLDHLGLDRVHLVGHDLGGLVAYAFTRLYSKRVEKLAIADAPLPLFGLDVPMWPQIEKQLWHLNFFHVPDLPEALIGGREQMFLTWFFKNGAYDTSAITAADIEEYTRAYTAPGALRSGFAFNRARELSAAEVKAAAQTKMTTPLLFLGNELTRLGDLFAEPLKEIATNFHIATVPRSGHWMPEENPSFVTQQLLSFFA